MDTLINQLAAVFSDPRTIGTLLTGIFVSLVVPALREWRKDRTARKNLLILIYEDINERVNRLQIYSPKLEEAIKRAEKEKEYEPCILETEGETHYIDWQTEKWLLPTEIASRILHFYNRRSSVTSIVEFLATDRFGSLSKERRLVLYRILLSEMQKTRDSGTSISRVIADRGWV